MNESKQESKQKQPIKSTQGEKKYFKRDKFNKRNNKNQENKFAYKNILYTTKVNKTTKGGRNTSFYIISVIGDCKSFVGIGVGKSRSVPNAIDKSIASAQTNIIRPVEITNLKYKSGSAKLIITKNKNNTIRAPSYVASIFEAFGKSGISCKIIGTRNQMNVIFAIFNSLKEMIKISEILKNRNQYISETLKQ